MEEILEFGKDSFVKILKKLRVAESLGLWVEVTRNGTSNSYSYQISACRYFKIIWVVLTYERDGKKVFPPSSLKKNKVKIFDLLKSLDLEAQQRCLVETGNQWYFQNFFGKPKVQDC